MSKHVRMRRQLKAEASPGHALHHPSKACGREGRPAFALGPPDVKHRAIEAHLIPTKVADLGRPQPMPEGDQDRGGVPMAVSVGFGRLLRG